MASITLRIQDFEIEADEISADVWEAIAILERNSIEPEDLHGEWSVLENYIREDCEISLDFERVARWIVAGNLSDSELLDLSYRIVRELVGRLESIRQTADHYRDTTRQQADRIRELEKQMKECTEQTGYNF